MRMANILKISTMSIALLAGTAVVTAVAVPDVAYAGKGNDNGNGNGGKSAGKGKSGGDTVSKGNSAGKGKSAGNGGTLARGKSDAARTLRSLGNALRGKSDDTKRRSGTKKRVATALAPEVAPAPAQKPRGNALARELGVHPSELGALNAAHASPTALANASPNSRVGRIAIYRDEVLESQELQTELDMALADLAGLDTPDRSIEDIDAALVTAGAEKQALEDELAALNDELAGGADVQSDIDTVTNLIGEKDAEISGLEQEREDGIAYADAADEVERLEGELDTQLAEQRLALEDAANKEVNDDVEIAVQKLLGIY